MLQIKPFAATVAASSWLKVVNKIKRHKDESVTNILMANGRVYNISEFYSSKPDKYPYRDRKVQARCPVCGLPVIPVFPSKRKHHARHKTEGEGGKKCPYRNHPETALHLNTKFYIRDVLVEAAGPQAILRVKTRCPGYQRTHLSGVQEPTVCQLGENGGPNEVEIIWLTGWDDAQVERNIAVVNEEGRVRRADATVMGNQKVLTAFEVLCSNAVSLPKAEELLEAGVPWLEIKATHELTEGPQRWTIDQPLPVERLGPQPPRCCPACAEAAYESLAAWQRLVQNQQEQQNCAQQLQQHQKALDRSEDTLEAMEAEEEEIHDLRPEALEILTEVFESPTKVLTAWELDPDTFNAEQLICKAQAFGQLKAGVWLPFHLHTRHARAMAKRATPVIQRYMEAWAVASRLPRLPEGEDEMTSRAEVKDYLRARTRWLQDQLSKLREEYQWLLREEQQLRQTLA